MKPKIYDISPLLGEATAVWPGDIALRRSGQLHLASGDSVELSSVTTTVHIGAHADAPSHYKLGADSIDAVELDPYIGPCSVISCLAPHQRLIQASDCAAAVRRGARRLLFRTLSFPDPMHFNTDFVAFSPEAMTFMGEAGVKLIGIDTPSVDPFESKSLTAHHELWRWNMRNLEGLCLADVADGDYELIALPLKLKGFDASPVRAILRQLD